MYKSLEKVIELAKSKNGYLEKSRFAYAKDHNIVYELTSGAGKDNITECWEDIKKSFQGNAWCCCFVYWLFWKCFGEGNANKALYINNWKPSDGWDNFDCTSWAENFEANGLRYQSSKAKVGDIIYFTNGKRVHHTGLVIDIKDGYVYTVEGNTSLEEKVIPNGGAVVYGKKYKLGSDNIYCYGRPNYSYLDKNLYPVIMKGYKDCEVGGSYCSDLQDSLNFIGIRDNNYNMLSVDGSCGGKTVQAIKNFLKKYNLVVDGYFGSACWTKLNEILISIKPSFWQRLNIKINNVLSKIIK